MGGYSIGYKGVTPWGVAMAANEPSPFLSSRPTVKVHTGPGAEAWGERFIRDRAPSAILPGDWPDASHAGRIDPQDESHAFWRA